MTTIDSAVADAGRRARDYRDIDGLLTLAASAYGLLIGSLGLWSHRTHSVWADLIKMGVLVGFLFAGLPDSPIMRRVKSRLTYPRTGYVALPQPKSIDSAEPQGVAKKRNLRKWAGGLAVLIGLAFFAYDPNLWVGFTVLTAGLGILWLTYHGTPEFSWIYILCAWLSGLVVATLQIARPERMDYALIVLGILSFFRGTTRLWRYLRQHPAPQGQEEGTHV